MIKIENVDIHGIARAVYSARNAMNSWDKSDSDFEKDMLGDAEVRNKGQGGVNMKILISADENPLIFGCCGCGCVFIADKHEYYYDRLLYSIFCVCPVCGARCKGEKESCYICKNRQLDSNGCDYKEYDAEHCEYFNVDKSALWRELGIYDKD